MASIRPFFAGAIVSAAAYSIFSSQIQHDNKVSRQQLQQLSAKVLRAADEPVPFNSIPSEQGYLSKALGPSADIFGSFNLRVHANNAAEYWNGGVRSVAAALTGGKA
ncbi:hypothetical protein HDU99_000988, partial [Rhizoclosmatium hyalinum]